MRAKSNNCKVLSIAQINVYFWGTSFCRSHRGWYTSTGNLWRGFWLFSFLSLFNYFDFLRTRNYAETSLNSKEKSENLRMGGSNKRHVFQNNMQEKRIIENSTQFSMLFMGPNLEIFTQWNQKVVHFSHQQRISRRDGLSILMNSSISQQMMTGISLARQRYI